MTPEAERLLRKAARALAAAEVLERSGSSEFACGRAYYAMFYVAEALLAEVGESFRWGAPGSRAAECR